MATILDSVIDRQRRADIAKNAAAMGEPARTAHGITRTGLAHVAGQHIGEAPNAAFFSEADLLAADVARDVNKGQKLAARNDAAAVAAQVMDMDAMRRAGWL